MGQCKKCGAFNADNCYYCQNCGTELKRDESEYQPVNNIASSPVNRKEESPTSFAFVQDDTKSEKTEPETIQNNHQEKDITDPSNYSLKWHKWLINVMLWFWALVDAANSVLLMNSGFPLLGFLFAALAVFYIYTRFQLARYKRGAFEKLRICLICNCVIAGINLLSGSSNGSSQLVISIAWLIGNWRYYTNRKQLFIN